MTRYEIDANTEEEIRKKERFGDPLKNIIKKDKEVSGDNNIGVIKRSFYLPNCKFVAPTNRFNIEPGYRWDGVDRSSGFENRYLANINLRKAREEEYYRLRTEDM